MLVLFETSVGFAIFKVLDENVLRESKDLESIFEVEQKANNVIQLHKFRKFANSEESMQAATALLEGKICKPLLRLLKKVYSNGIKDQLMVFDPKLGGAIQEKLKIDVTCSGPVQEIMRCIKFKIVPVIPGIEKNELRKMSLVIGHKMARCRLKISAEKVDTMVSQSVYLLDDLDKNIKNYIIMVKEYYGMHFPELKNLIPDSMTYIKAVQSIGNRNRCNYAAYAGILAKDDAVRIQQCANFSSGEDFADEDIENIRLLCIEIQDLSKYRVVLQEYLETRMRTVAPNLTIIVGEMLGASLIVHAGSLIKLAKLPASTIQLLGAGNALFTALKNRKATPRCGIIYHTPLISDASERVMGKIARMVATKAALAARCDVFGETPQQHESFFQNVRSKLDLQMQAIEDGYTRKLSGKGRSQHKFDSHKRKSEVHTYNNKKDENLEKKPMTGKNKKSIPTKKFKVDITLNGECTMTTVDELEFVSAVQNNLKNGTVTENFKLKVAAKSECGKQIAAEVDSNLNVRKKSKKGAVTEKSIDVKSECNKPIDAQIDLKTTMQKKLKNRTVNKKSNSNVAARSEGDQITAEVNTNSAIQKKQKNRTATKKSKVPARSESGKHTAAEVDSKLHIKKRKQQTNNTQLDIFNETYKNYKALAH